MEEHDIPIKRIAKKLKSLNLNTNIEIRGQRNMLNNIIGIEAAKSRLQ